MKKILVVVAMLPLFSLAQNAGSVINVKEVERVEKTLSSDALRGRKVFTKDIQKASAFIENEFKKTGLKPFNGSKNFRQEFSMTESVNTTAHVVIDDRQIEDSSLAVFSFQPQVSFTNSDSVEVVKIAAGDNIRQQFYTYFNSDKNLLVLVDSSFQPFAARIKSINNAKLKPGQNTVVFVFGVMNAHTFSVKLDNKVTQKPLNNVVGIIPGKSKPNEYVIFSGHYDHLGVGEPKGKDSIYNGANDDAAGTTAVILLAKYFKALHNNRRTLVFAAFTAEEIGEYGSEYFSEQFDPAKVTAMFNIEMIGTESKWGKNSAYITGYEKTNMGKILEKNLQGSLFKFYPDPYTAEQLFYRSDNATLARKGAPAHTISTSKMDNEPNYHQLSDEIGTLDLKNMAAIIKAIAKSSVSIVNGKDAPTRVNPDDLK